MALIPAGRLIDWTPSTHVGVIGGIPTNRTNMLDATQAPYNADKTGATDTHAAINAAISAVGSHDGVFLPAGTYRVDSTLIANSSFNNKTLRGAGMDATIIDMHVSVGLLAGQSDGIAPPQVTPMRVVSGLTAGSTSVTVTPDASGLSVGQLFYFMFQNDDNIPVAQVYNFDVFTTQSPSTQQHIITSLGTNTISFIPPLFETAPAGETRVIRNTFWANGIGIEDLCVDATNAPLAQSCIQLASCYGGWIKNCKAKYATNYPIKLDYSLNCEIRHCTIIGLGGGHSNGAGILFGAHSTLVEDNIIYDNFPNIEVNLGSAGNVIAYNYGPDDQMWNTNHAPFNRYNLYEGNAIGFLICDGYFGGQNKMTAFRNYFHGTITGVNLRRFNRNSSVVGNIMQSDTTVGCGLPNIGNGSFTGTAQLSLGDPWLDWKMTGTLTTRTDNDNGVVTLASGHLTNPDQFATQLINLIWGAGHDNQNGCNVISVTGNTAVIQRSSGLALPAQGTVLSIGPGSFFGQFGGSYQEMDLDVAATLVKKGNRYLTNNSFDSLGGDTLPDSLYTSKAEMVARGVIWGSLAFPPFDPVTPVTPNVQNIPAGYRFVNGFDPGVTPVAPSNVSLPTAGGSTIVGGTMTFTLGSWSGTPAPTFTSILRLCAADGSGGSDISGQTGLTYTPVTGDIGHTIRIRVTATNTQGSSTVDSAPSAVITSGGGGGGPAVVLSGSPLMS